VRRPAAVLNWLKDNNKGAVSIHTFLFGVDGKGREVMLKIAKEHGGTFKSLSLDE